MSHVPLRSTAAGGTSRVAALALVAALAAGTIAACVSTQPPADTDPQLSGQWQLNSSASDHLEARVAQAVDRAEAQQRRRISAYERERARAEANADESAQPGSEPMMPMPFIGPDFKQLRARLLQILAAPLYLNLQVRAGAVTIQSDQLPERDYAPGESFLRVDEYGSATVSCGWSGRVFVIRQRYTSRAELTERFEVDPKTGTLTYTRTLKDPTVGDIGLKSVYHHA